MKSGLRQSSTSSLQRLSHRDILGLPKLLSVAEPVEAPIKSKKKLLCDK